MKKLILTFAALLAVRLCAVAELNHFPLVVSSVTPNVVASATTNQYASKVTGCVEGLFLDFTGAAATTCTVQVVTDAGSVGFAQTLFSADVSADAYYPIRLVEVNSGGATNAEPYGRFILLDNKVTIKAYSANTGTNAVAANMISIRATVVMED